MSREHRSGRVPQALEIDTVGLFDGHVPMSVESLNAVRVSDFSLGGVEFGEDHRPSPQKSLSLDPPFRFVEGVFSISFGCCRGWA